MVQNKNQSTAKSQEKRYCPVSHDTILWALLLLFHNLLKRGVYDVLPHWVLGEVDNKVGTLRFVAV